MANKQPLKVRSVKEVWDLLQKGKGDTVIDTSFIHYHCTPCETFKLKYLFENEWTDLDITNHNLYIYGPNAGKIADELITKPSKPKIEICYLAEGSDLEDTFKHLEKDMKSRLLITLPQTAYESYSEQDKHKIDELIRVGRGYNIGVLIYAEKNLNMDIAKNCQTIYLTDKDEDYLQFSQSQKIYQGSFDDMYID